MSQENIKLLHKIDEIATDNSEYGYRFIYDNLKKMAIQLVGIEC